MASAVISDTAARYPLLLADLDALRELGEPELETVERAAVIAQNRHRRQQVIIALLPLLPLLPLPVTVVAAVQAALPDSALPGARR